MDTPGNAPWRRHAMSGIAQSSQPQAQRNPRKRPADTQEADWVAGEDKFVLQQAKRKAEIRVREGRARPIDWLAVTLRFVDSARTRYDDEVPDSKLDIVDPEGVFEGLAEQQLTELEKDIDVYKTLEESRGNRDFWNTMLVICQDRRRHSQAHASGGRGVESVSSDVDRLLGNKSLDELESLEKQIKAKLRSDGPIDVEYWEHLLANLTSWKARCKLRQISRSLIDNKLQGLRLQQREEAQKVHDKVLSLLDSSDGDVSQLENKVPPQLQSLDPEPLLKVGLDDRALPIHDERELLGQIATKTLFEREAARGIGENEEVFLGEEEVTTTGKHEWRHGPKPRKPRYFNRVQMGYEWNKYNQTHYDHDNPPPRVVHGYKFNIFYPDLIDNRKAPTYKIEREHGRKRGQSFAPAGEDDTCLIRFMAGPPYEDVAFRIIDKEWDYSAKRERGFRSSYDKGILQLHFQFKKIFYRK